MKRDKGSAMKAALPGTDALRRITLSADAIMLMDEQRI